MAGHSQFKNIMHRKGRQDKVRAQLFTRLQREIQTASKAGLPDPAFNPRLRAAIQAAKAANMPKDNIERAIKRGQGGDARELRRGALRGLRARRRRGDRRGADRQPQPYRELGALELRQAWRGAGRDQQRQLPVQPRRSDQLPGERGQRADAMLEAAIEAGADDCESSEDGHEITCAAGRAGRRAGTAGGAFRAARAGDPDLEAADHGAASTTRRPRRCSSCSRRWTTTTTCSGWSPTSRSPTRRSARLAG